MQNKLVIGLGVAVVLVLGTFFMAQSAVPGGLFYGIKTGLIEQVEASFVGNDARAQAEWQLTLAERRLNESARAARKGKFDSDAQEQVLLSFNEQMKGIESYIEQLQTEEKKGEVKDIAVMVGQRLARNVDIMAATQAELKAKQNPETQGSLDFLILRASNAVAAAANIAARTGIEDEAPDTSHIPPTDEEGNPL